MLRSMQIYRYRPTMTITELQNRLQSFTDTSIIQDLTLEDPIHNSISGTFHLLSIGDEVTLYGFTIDLDLRIVMIYGSSGRRSAVLRWLISFIHDDHEHWDDFIENDPDRFRMTNNQIFELIDLLRGINQSNWVKKLQLSGDSDHPIVVRETIPGTDAGLIDSSYFELDFHLSDQFIDGTMQHQSAEEHPLRELFQERSRSINFIILLHEVAGLRPEETDNPMRLDVKYDFSFRQYKDGSVADWRNFVYEYLTPALRP